MRGIQYFQWSASSNMLVLEHGLHSKSPPQSQYFTIKTDISKCYISKMFHIPYFVYNMPCFIKSKELLTIKGTPIYVTSTKGEKLPIIMVCYILISEMLKCEKKVS